MIIIIPYSLALKILSRNSKRANKEEEEVNQGFGH